MQIVKYKPTTTFTKIIALFCFANFTCNSPNLFVFVCIVTVTANHLLDSASHGLSVNQMYICLCNMYLLSSHISQGLPNQMAKLLFK